MYAPKLKTGDEIRIIAPSRSLSLITQATRDIAEKKLKEIGFTLTYSKNAEENDLFASSSIKSRVDDLHEAFTDKNVKGILTVIGGYNINQILRYIDYDLIAKHPKVICGFSDITALSNAIYAKTGLVSYSGPHYSSFGMRQGIAYTAEYFKKCLIEEGSFKIEPAKEWSDDVWYLDQEKRQFMKSDGYLTINNGKAAGKLLGGNLCTFNLLQGTEYFPDLKDSILFIEDDEESRDVAFDRDLQSLIHQPGFSGVKGVVIGRFQNASKMTDEKLFQIIRTKKELASLPVVANVDFGHTTPQITFPIGGSVELRAESGDVSINILEH